MPRDPKLEEFHGRVVAFVRAFGLHRPDETPCGAPVPVSEAHALEVLTAQDELSQRELGLRLLLTKSTVSRLVDQLEHKGWVQRRVGEVDTRARLVSLTTEGHKVADQINQRRAERMAHVLAHIPDRDRSTVMAALDLLVEASREQ